jgi:hypothetical protein
MSYPPDPGMEPDRTDRIIAFLVWFAMACYILVAVALVLYGIGKI